MEEPLERDEPIPVRTVCDTPEAIAEALNSLPEYGEAMFIECDGKPLGALIPMKDLDLYQRLFFDREMEIDIAAGGAAIEEGGEAVSIEALMEEFGITAKA